MSDALKVQARRAVPLNDRYLALLAVVLLGYALMGRGFAYIGLPPLYVGEIALLAGLAVFVRSGASVASLATLPSLVLAVTMAWVLARTLPFVGAYGFDALRDSVIIMYGGFAFVVIALLLEDGRRIDTVLRYYGVLLAAFPLLAVGFLLTKYWADHVPSLYGPNISIIEIGASAMGTHLAGTAVFVLIGYRRVSLLWAVIWLGALAMTAATNRGATLAALLPILFAMVMLGRLQLLLKTIAGGLLVLGVLYAAEAAFSRYDEAADSMDRPVSAHQLVENAKSLFGQAGRQTEGTINWRLAWWDIIISDTLHGPNFWAGRGFGLNLADADGFTDGVDPNNPRPPTRSPHNAHMTMLARAGVPGAVLWSLVLLSWGAMMLRAMLVARSRGHRHWVELFLFTACYAASIVINAMFDVTLEGPVQGIWFWCLFGFGVGSVMVYRAQYAGSARSAT